MTDDLRLEIEAEAFASLPRECCGYIVRSFATGAFERVPCANVAERPETSALFAPSDSQKALMRGLITGTYHSHPLEDESPSNQDVAACNELDVPFYIFSTQTLGWAKVVPATYPAQPYTGREFVFGIDDCFNLAREWYRRELKIDVRPKRCREDFWSKGQNVFVNGFAEEGFVTVADDVKVGDVYLMCIKSPKHLPNHCAVYTGSGCILHHLWQRLSCQEPLLGLWSKCIHSRLRHRSLC